jgi:ParB family chromosome partitioning protein
MNASRISPEDAQEFTEALAQSVGASWRQIALAKRMGVPKALGLSVDQWVTSKLGGYVRMAVEDRRQAVQELKAEGLSNREAAEVLGIDAHTVRRDVDGANAPPTNGFSHEEASPAGANAPPADLPRESLPHVANNTGNNEWYTPPEIIEAAREVMGSIDVDPASCATANEWIRATTYFDAQTDGLVQRWNGKVWLNPPYAQPLLTDFVDALLAKVKAQEVSQACVLVNNATETRWFQALGAASVAVCFMEGRVRYIDASGSPALTPLQGQAVAYFGLEVPTFCKVFARFGLVGMLKRPRP